MKGYIPIALITKIVGVILALIVFQFVYNEILKYCQEVWCSYIAIIVALFAFVTVLAFFIGELRVFVKWLPKI